MSAISTAREDHVRHGVVLAVAEAQENLRDSLRGCGGGCGAVQFYKGRAGFRSADLDVEPP